MQIEEQGRTGRDGDGLGDREEDDDPADREPRDERLDRARVRRGAQHRRRAAEALQRFHLVLLRPVDVHVRAEVARELLAAVP